jgi:hypothetical protein
MAKAKNTSPRKAARKAKSGKARGTFHADPNVRLKRVGDKTHDLSKYVKATTKAGNTSLHCGDELAAKLEGKDLDTVYKIAAKTLDIPEKDLRSRYKHLNVGMQRMNLGNRMRAA